ncbi:hypothetical protein MNBD_GAMMA12-1551 [hydrothermal vent metagenome]|uniref:TETRATRICOPEPTIDE REPEAT FAMILY PROTEIN n=1 Tax=hydrothermal vent metagenome TaxID=652676 RepID=A0A3B0YN41_9ZZZZ
MADFRSRRILSSVLVLFLLVLLFPLLVNAEAKVTIEAETPAVSEKPVAVDSPKNKSPYQSWIKSAEKGVANAQFNLGLIFEQGTEIQKDLSKAVYWYKKAAGQGHTVAQYNYATLLHFGKGISKDETKAAHWYQLAAKKGHTAAQSSLAFLYLQHVQTKFRDTKKAAYWYKKAAKLGYPEAQFNLGLLYASGKGVLLNYAQAYAWLDMAHLNQYKNALKSRNRVAAHLTQKQLKEAMQLSKSLHQLYFRKNP